MLDPSAGDQLWVAYESDVRIVVQRRTVETIDLSGFRLQIKFQGLSDRDSLNMARSTMRVYPCLGFYPDVVDTYNAEISR